VDHAVVATVHHNRWPVSMNGPQPGGAVLSPGEHLARCGIECHAEDICGVALQPTDQLATGLPDAHNVVVARCGNPRSIWAQGRSVYRLANLWERAQEVVCGKRAA